MTSPACIHTHFTIGLYTPVWISTEITFVNLNHLGKGEKKMRILWRVLAALVLIAAILGIGVYAYNLGMTQGQAQNVQAPAGQAVTLPAMHYGQPFFRLGFGLFGCLIPLFLLCLVFGSLRALLWHGPMGWRHMHRRDWDWRDPNGKSVPPFFAEWHRRAHAEPEDEKAGKPQ
jgi:hypothetical protein